MMPYELLQDLGERKKGTTAEAVELTGGGMAGAIQIAEMVAAGQVREVPAPAKTQAQPAAGG